MNQSELEASTYNWRKARENLCVRVTIDLSFTFSFADKVARVYLRQSRNVVTQNTNCRHSSENRSGAKLF